MADVLSALFTFLNTSAGNFLILGASIIIAAKVLGNRFQESIDSYEHLFEMWLLMKRQEVILMIDDAGFEIPEWLEEVDDDDDEDEEDEPKVLKLVKKEDPTS